MEGNKFDQKTRALFSSRHRRFAIPAMLASLFGTADSVSAKPKQGRIPAIPDPETGPKVILEGKLMDQRGPDEAGPSERRGNRRPTYTRVGVRQIYYAACGTYTGVWCVVTCPADYQAIGGGLLSTDGNGFLGVDSPTSYYNQWATWLYSLAGYYTSATAYVVCMRT